MDPLPDCPILDLEIQGHRKMIEREIGVHDERLKTLEREMGEIRADVKEVLKQLNEARGGWKTLMLVAGAAGAMGAVVGKVLPFLKP